MQQNRISSNCAVVPAFLRWTEQQVHSFLLVSPQRQLSSNENQYYFFYVSKHCKWAFHKEINPVHEYILTNSMDELLCRISKSQ